MMERLLLPRYTGTKVTASDGKSSRSSVCSAIDDEKNSLHESVRALCQE